MFAGGGRGGYMVALTPDTDCRIAVAAAMEKEGYHFSACGILFGNPWVQKSGVYEKNR